MAPEWWVEAQFAAEDEHDPDAYGGREWAELSEGEQADAINEHLYAVADARDS